MQDLLITKKFSKDYETKTLFLYLIHPLFGYYLFYIAVKQNDPYTLHQ